MKIRAGSVNYKGREVPKLAKIYTSEKGREFWISAVGEKKSYIIFVDDGSFLELNSLYLKSKICIE